MTVDSQVIQTIYGLVDPTTGLLRYVGVTRFTPEVRLYKHKIDTLSLNTRLAQWLRGLLSTGRLPMIVVIERGYDRRRERFWIEHYRRAGVPLTNLTNGGRSPDGKAFTPEHRAKIAASKVGRKHPPMTQEQRTHMARNRGIPPSPECREKIRQAGLGHPVSEITREKIRQALTGRTLDPEHVAKSANAR